MRRVRACVTSLAALMLLLASFAMPQVASASAPGTLCFVREGALFAAPGGSGAHRVAALPAATSYGVREAGPGQVLVECSTAEWLSSTVAMDGATTDFVLVSLSGATSHLGTRLGGAETLAVAGDGKKVALARAGELFVGTVDSVKKVATLPGGFVHGLEWSHGGTRVAFVAARATSGSNRSPEQLYVFDLNTRQIRQLTHNEDNMDMGGQAAIFAPHFSADDAVIGYVQGRRGDSRFLDFVRTDGAQLGWSSVAGSDAGVCADADGPFDLSHAGDSVVYSTGNLDNADYQTQNVIYLLEKASNPPAAERQLAAAGGCDWDPAFSIDDALVAFVRFPGLSPGPEAGGRIWVIGRNGSGAHDLGPGVSPLWVSAPAAVTAKKPSAGIGSQDFFGSVSKGVGDVVAWLEQLLSVFAPMTKTAPVAPKVLPVLLVHGLDGWGNDQSDWIKGGWISNEITPVDGGSGWEVYKENKKDHSPGIFDSAPVYMLDYHGYHNAAGHIKPTAGILSRAIDVVEKDSHASHVYIVAHSMGGLMARAVIEGFAVDPANYDSHDNEKRRPDIYGLMTIDTPHRGCIPAAGLLGFANHAWGDMVPDSDFMKDLNRLPTHMDATFCSVVVGNALTSRARGSGDGVLTATEQTPIPGTLPSSTETSSFAVVHGNDKVHGNDPLDQSVTYPTALNFSKIQHWAIERYRQALEKYQEHN